MHRLAEGIDVLPAQVPFGNVDQRQLAAVGQGGYRLRLGAQIVHVRQDIDQRDAGGDVHPHMAPVVVPLGRNGEVLGADHHAVHPMLHRPFAEMEADAAFVPGRLAGGMVVDLEDDVARPLRQPHGVAFGQQIGIDTGRPAADAPGLLLAAVIEEVAGAEDRKTGLRIPGVVAPGAAGIVHEDVGVVHHATGAGLEFHRRQRPPLREFEGDDEIAVEVGAAGRHREGLGHLQHHVGGTGAPFGVGPHGFGQGIFGAPARRAGLGPGGEERHLARRKVALAAKGAETLRRAPGRHDAFGGDMGQRLRAARRLGIAVQREGRDGPGPVAFDAMGGQQGLDVAVVGHLVRQRLVPGLEDAAHRLGAARRRDAALAERVQHGLQVVMGEGVAQHADGGEAVVDAPAVDGPVVGGDDEGFRHAARAEAQRQIAGAVEQHREGEAVIVDEGPRLGRRQQRVGDDAVKGDPGRIGASMERVQLRRIAVGDGAGGVHENQRQRHRLAVHAAQAVDAAGEVDHAQAVEMGRLARPGLARWGGGLGRGGVFVGRRHAAGEDGEEGASRQEQGAGCGGHGARFPGSIRLGIAEMGPSG